MRKSENKISPTLIRQIEVILSQTLADINNQDEAAEFLKGFLTKSEHETLAKRLAIAYWLKKGRSYRNIKENLKVSSATVSSVQSLMSTKGVREAIRRVEAEEWASQWSDRFKKFVGK